MGNSKIRFDPAGEEQEPQDRLPGAEEHIRGEMRADDDPAEGANQPPEKSQAI